jgi:hypothetical protein
VTAREFAQTTQLLKKFGINHLLIGRHQGRKLTRKAYGLVTRTYKLIKFGRKQKFDLALSHGSNDLALAASFLGIPHVTMFDYEFAKISHHINLRLATKIMIPSLIPSQRLYRYGATDVKIDKYPGLKEEYYLADFKPDPSILSELGLDQSKIIVVMRTPPDVSLYHRFENRLFEEVLGYLAVNPEVAVVLLPRTAEQTAKFVKMGFANVLVPRRAIDAQSLVYYSDLVISAGGTMNREAVALNTPVYTLFSGQLGAIDAHLISTGKMKRLKDLSEIELAKKENYQLGERRDINLWIEKFLSVVNKNH